jgi:hypothetical protein
LKLKVIAGKNDPDNSDSSEEDIESTVKDKL